jgi:hypothetical protein
LKYAVGALIAAAAIVLSFQNCKKTISDDSAVSSSSVFKIDLSQENPTFATLYFDELLTRQGASGSYQVISRTALKIDLQNGQIERTSEAALQPESFCLSSNKLAEINSILSGSQICKTQHTITPGTMCTMVYKYPYAAIATTREQFELGMEESGCPKETIDLCDDRGDLLVSYSEGLKSSYKQMNCSN